MAPPIFTGALMPKKKYELQEISVALKISDQGTKDELLNRIKKHLDLNPDLEEDPSFVGLFGNRKRRSVQPQVIIATSRSHPKSQEKPSSKGRRAAALDAIRESTPVNDLRDVSMFLKQPTSPFISTPDRAGQRAVDITPSSLPPLPPSPAKSLIEHLSPTENMEALAAKIKETEIMQSGIDMLKNLRRFLSNSRNIWSATAVMELLFIFYVVIPWRSVQIQSSVLQKAPMGITIVYPPWSTFQTLAFWSVLLHWALPTLVFPTIVGHLISFSTQHTRPSDSYQSLPFDPLTSAIIRLAAQVSYPYASLEKDVQGLDVLGYNWRVLSASVGLAFAFAEAISGSPKVFAQTLAAEHQSIRLLEASGSTEELSVPRRALMPAENLDEDEVD